MQIPLIYILIAAEALFLLLVACVILGIVTYKLSRRPVQKTVVTEAHHVDISTSYAEYLAQEIVRNDTQTHALNMTEPSAEENTGAVPHGKLLEMREHFLQTERLATDHHENPAAFWDQIYRGMQDAFDKFGHVEQHTEIISDTTVDHQHSSEEKVFYIETQGKKIDGELNHLKDIIFDQENTVNGLKKALKKAEEQHANDPESVEMISELRNQIENFERQLRDSKMCMEVLEMDNNRLQTEVASLEKRYTEAFGEKQEKSEESQSPVDIEQLRSIIDNQERKITELSRTIDGMQLESGQADKLKKTLDEFVRNSREMMNCIAILEEENEHMHEMLAETGQDTEATTAGGLPDEMKVQIKKLEEELIKKDVAYAKLQDEFASMEKEYLAMYNAIHGNNG
jgi:hypothetical protein